MNGIKGFEVHMGSNNPLSLIFSTDSDGNAYWQGVTISPVSTGNFILNQFELYSACANALTCIALHRLENSRVVEKLIFPLRI